VIDDLQCIIHQYKALTGRIDNAPVFLFAFPQPLFSFFALMDVDDDPLMVAGSRRIFDDRGTILDPASLAFFSNDPVILAVSLPAQPDLFVYFRNDPFPVAGIDQVPEHDLVAEQIFGPIAEPGDIGRYIDHFALFQFFGGEAPKEDCRTVVDDIFGELQCFACFFSVVAAILARL
jgi:hypothetical protein